MKRSTAAYFCKIIRWKIMSGMLDMKNVYITMRYLANSPCIKNKKACFNRINNKPDVWTLIYIYLYLNFIVWSIDKLWNNKKKNLLPAK